MTLRLSGGGLAAFVLTVAWSACFAGATSPSLVSAVSRMTHGSAGTFDIQFPLQGRTGIECRSVDQGVTLVLTFDQPVKGGNASVAEGTATLAGTPAFLDNTMTVHLGSLADAQTVSVAISKVRNAAGEAASAKRVRFRLLRGDVNASGTITASDVSICKSAISRAATVTASTFRCDIDHNGLLSTADLNLIKAQSTASASVTGGASANTPPTITSIGPQTAISGQQMTPVGFTVGDAESDPATLGLTGTSSDQATVPNANITFGGSGASRTVSLVPASGITTVTNLTITVTVSDGVAQTPTSFALTVVPPPTVYLATLQPIAGVNSLGSGTATLSLSGDLTFASLRYSFSNLAGADSDDAVYAPGDVVLYDIPVGKAHGDVQPDGSYKWVFGAEAAQAIAAIQANQSYITIESAAFPAGELRGTFQKVTGSQTFTPPPPPPAITINPPTPYDASRLLQQAAFGGKATEIFALANPLAPNASTAIDDWLTQQFNSAMPIAPAYDSANPVYSSSSMYKQIYDRVTTPQPPSLGGDTLGDDRVHEAWWKNVVSGQDQLRQRIATAYSELFVVSEVNDTLDGNIPGLASYYDMLANDAFVNFRTLLNDVTLHPIMGEYLNMRGNNKAVPPASPNENYAREIQQLFTIGLYMLQPDGTLVLDQNGQPIATYDQTTITQFAQVFTGWNTSGSVNIPVLVAPVPPATVATVQPFGSSYQKHMVLTAGNHSGTTKTLLSYTGAPTYTGPKYPSGTATVPSFIPASTPSAQSTQDELNFALDDIFLHPNVGPFICRQLIQRLVCSNPSPGYVYRVAQVFANDGLGLPFPQSRGNMQAVIRAILTDYEARSPSLRTQPGYGRAREPMIRMANILRSTGGISVTNKWMIGKTDNTLAQTVLRSPTVFNFFDPHFTPAGVVQSAGIVAPEFDIIYETTITNAQNMIYTGIYGSNYNTNPITGTGFRGDSFGNDVYLDFSTAGSGLMNVAQTQGVGPLLDRVSLLLTGAALDPKIKSRIQVFILGNVNATDYLNQTRAAVHLISTSPACAIQR
ncbi:MAG TPA: DUF1800 family protein [Tepidisphaeraceae bacterium]|jgi:uncharacterized protein (DUF1800 family)